MTIIPGTTDQSVWFTAFDDAGDPVTLTAASAGLAIFYDRLLKGILIGSAYVPTITDLAFLSSPHSDGGLRHYVNGEHRLDMPDAAFAAGADEVRIYVTATAITGGVVHGPIWLQAERASSIAAAVWEHSIRTLTMTVGQVADMIAGDRIRIRHGTTFTFTQSGLQLANTAELVFVLKSRRAGSVDIARISDLTGLITLNGVAPSDSTLGNVTYDAVAGTATVLLTDEATDLMSEQDWLKWAIRQSLTTGEEFDIAYGTGVIESSP